MINFRYHVVSLTAVFLALAIGLVVGTAALNGPVADSLKDQVSALSKDNSNFRAQANQVFENLRAGLAAAGADFGDVVKLTFYILDVRNLPALREIRDRYVDPAAPPASTLVQVSRLFRDDVLLEVEAIAAVRDRAARGGAEP